MQLIPIHCEGFRPRRGRCAKDAAYYAMGYWFCWGCAKRFLEGLPNTEDAIVGYSPFLRPGGTVWDVHIHDGRIFRLQPKHEDAPDV